MLSTLMPLITALAWLAIPVGLACIVDDWLLRPRRQVRVGEASLRDPPAMAFAYYAMPVLIVAAVLRLLVAETLDFSLVLFIIAVATGIAWLVDALVLRKRALLDRLVEWARRRGLPYDARPEPTPGHVRRAAAGEFTVARDQYVRANTGWFSDRSACYLAAGRPVITQETGFSKFFPNGKGLFGFRTMDDILRAVDAIQSDYAGNCRAARDIAAEYFAAEKVVGSLMERAGL